MSSRSVITSLSLQRGLAPAWPLSPAGGVDLVPIIHPDVDDRGHILECYTARHGGTPECGCFKAFHSAQVPLFESTSSIPH